MATVIAIPGPKERKKPSVPSISEATPKATTAPAVRTIGVFRSVERRTASRAGSPSLSASRALAEVEDGVVGDDPEHQSDGNPLQLARHRQARVRLEPAEDVLGDEEGDPGAEHRHDRREHRPQRDPDDEHDQQDRESLRPVQPARERSYCSIRAGSAPVAPTVSSRGPR